MNREEHRQSFKATDEQGNTHTLHVYVAMIDAGSLEGPHEIEGQKHIEDDMGRSVNRKSQGRYELVPTGQILTSDDPNAP